jgi:hypothetical protein
LQGPLVLLFEVVGAEEQPVVPVDPQPADIIDNRLNELLLLPGGVGVIEPQVEETTEFLSDAVVDPDSLRVSDMKVGVGLRREARVDAGESPGTQILDDGPADEVHRHLRAPKPVFFDMRRAHDSVAPFPLSGISVRGTSDRRVN